MLCDIQQIAVGAFLLQHLSICSEPLMQDIFENGVKYQSANVSTPPSSAVYLQVIFLRPGRCC